MNDEINQLKNRIAELEAELADQGEIIGLLEKTNKQLKKGLAEAQERLVESQTALLRAKDSSEVERASETRTSRLADQAGMSLSRWGRGWIIRFGKKRRWFKKLKDVWLVLTQPDWKLTDFFNPKLNKIPSRKPKPNSCGNFNGHRPDCSTPRPWTPWNLLSPDEQEQVLHNPIVRRQYEALFPHSRGDLWHQDHLRALEEAELATAFT